MCEGHGAGWCQGRVLSPHAWLNWTLDSCVAQEQQHQQMRQQHQMRQQQV
jgi:hypothetical protein